MTNARIESYAWDALAESAEEAANLKVRAELMRKIAVLIHGSDWTQVEATQHSRSS